MNRGDVLPTPTLQPQSLYPPNECRPVPLRSDDVDFYLLTLKQDLRTTFRNSKYFVNPAKPKQKIERYSDKYESLANRLEVSETGFEPHSLLFPQELRDGKKEKKKAENFDGEDILKKLSRLEEVEDKMSDSEEDKEREEEEPEPVGEENEDDIDVEEGTDYALAYFDNGESYLDDSDDNLDEGPTY